MYSQPSKLLLVHRPEEHKYQVILRNGSDETPLAPFYYVPGADYQDTQAYLLAVDYFHEIAPFLSAGVDVSFEVEDPAPGVWN